MMRLKASELSEHRAYKKPQDVPFSYSRQKRKKIVSHVGIALSNIPSLLCWLLLLRWGTFAIPHLIQNKASISC